MSDYLPMYATVGSTATTLERTPTSGCSVDDKNYTRLLSETKIRDSVYTAYDRKNNRHVDERESTSKSNLKSRICTIFLSLLAVSLLVTTIVGVALACTARTKKRELCQTNSTECTISLSHGQDCKTSDLRPSLVVSQVQKILLH